MEYLQVGDEVVVGVVPLDNTAGMADGSSLVDLSPFTSVGTWRCGEDNYVSTSS